MPSAPADPPPSTGRLSIGRRTRAAALIGCLLAVLLVGCQRDYAVELPDSTNAQVEPALAAAALRDLVSAVRAGDLEAAAALAPADDAAAQELLRGMVANAVAIGVEDFSLRYVADLGGVSAEGGWRATVDVAWSFEDFHTTPALTEVVVSFARSDAGLAVTGIGGHGRRSPLWLTAGALEVRRGPQTLVVVDADAATADRYDEMARAAVPVVHEVLPQWHPRLVVEVPRDPEALAAALDVAVHEYAQVAAVTAAADGSTSRSAPVHVFVNPRVFGALGDEGAQVVLSHEAVHVATQAPFAPLPLWLLEGFADYVALRDVDLPLTTTAGQIAAQVRADGVPEELPGPDEFATNRQHLGAAYEAAWLACTTIAAHAGEEALVELYTRASAGEPVEDLLVEVIGWTYEDLVAAWQQRLRTLP
ncbi:hypothetical protein [Nocardioides limicola]|uniref:hypothetical protein n=1 Tax=Nocardioides limicola TaxID=2803368 RepID=UPI00193C2DFB|nr:hypothetical protein [Nocardioides sp. DJM-14]